MYVAPASPGDVPDERDARLVILGPEFPHVRGAADSKARKEAVTYLEQRGTGPRLYRNTLVFLAADNTRLEELIQATRQFLAWRSIEAERETLNLDAFQSNQARTKRETSEDSIKQRIPETYHWLLVPEKPDPNVRDISWQEMRVQGTDGIAIRAGKRLRNEEMLVTQLAGTMLRRELDKIPLWPADVNHILVKTLLDYFAQHLYLPRLKDGKVLLDAIQGELGLTTWQQDSFAYADQWDEQAGRYAALRAGQIVTVGSDGRGVLVEARGGIEADGRREARVACGRSEYLRAVCSNWWRCT